jgi:hypothetical protein
MVQIATLLLFVPCLVLLLAGFAKQSRARFLALCLLLISLFTAGQTSYAQFTSSAPNLILNGGFEEGNDADLTWAGSTTWSPFNGASRRKKFANIVEGMPHGLRFMAELDESPTTGQAIEQTRTGLTTNDLVPGATYRLTAYISRERSTSPGTIQAKVEFLSSAGDPISSATGIGNWVLTPPSSTLINTSYQSQWNQYTLDVFCPTGITATGFRVRLSANTTGQTWGDNNGMYIDDVEFRRVLSNEPPNLLANGGFESGTGTNGTWNTDVIWTGISSSSRRRHRENAPSLTTVSNQTNLLDSSLKMAHSDMFMAELDEFASLGEGIQQVQSATLVPGVTYQLSAYLARERMVLGPGTVNAQIELLPATGTTVIATQSVNWTITPDEFPVTVTNRGPLQGQWERFSLNILCPPGSSGPAARVRVTLKIPTGTGQTWGQNKGIFIDDVSVNRD